MVLLYDLQQTIFKFHVSILDNYMLDVLSSFVIPSLDLKSIIGTEYLC